MLTAIFVNDNFHFLVKRNCTCFPHGEQRIFLHKKWRGTHRLTQELPCKFCPKLVYWPWYLELGLLLKTRGLASFNSVAFLCRSTSSNASCHIAAIGHIIPVLVKMGSLLIEWHSGGQTFDVFCETYYLQGSKEKVTQWKTHQLQYSRGLWRVWQERQENLQDCEGGCWSQLLPRKKLDLFLLYISP